MSRYPLNIVQRSFFKYCIILLLCQFIENISYNSFLTRPGTVITHCVGGGGGGGNDGDLAKCKQ
jgi:hypothetical protein